MTSGSLERGGGEVETVEKWLQIRLVVAVLLGIGFSYEGLRVIKRKKIVFIEKQTDTQRVRQTRIRTSHGKTDRH
jgi:hypothetical protein